MRYKLTIKSPSKWWGGKHYLRGKLLALFPPRDSYCTLVEDYGGMANVLFAHDPTGKAEIYNDLDGELTNFFEVLQSSQQYELFLRMAAVTPFSELQFRHSLAALQEPLTHLSYARAFHFFVTARQSHCGLRTKFAWVSKTRLRHGMNEQVSAWLSGVEGLYDVHQRLQRVLIRCVPALELLKEFDRPDILHYLDPPYYPSTRVAAKAYGAFEMTTAQHQELLDTLQTVQSKVLLSGYDCPAYEKALSAWYREEFTVASHASGQKRKRQMTEVAWRNYEQIATQDRGISSPRAASGEPAILCTTSKPSNQAD